MWVHSPARAGQSEGKRAALRSALQHYGLRGMAGAPPPGTPGHGGRGSDAAGWAWLCSQEEERWEPRGRSPAGRAGRGCGGRLSPGTGVLAASWSLAPCWGRRQAQGEGTLRPQFSPYTEGRPTPARRADTELTTLPRGWRRRAGRGSPEDPQGLSPGDTHAERVEAESRTRQPQGPTGPLPRGHASRARREGCSEPLGRPGQRGRGHQDESARRSPTPQERPPRERGQTKKRAGDATLGSSRQREDTRLRRQGGASKQGAAAGRSQQSRTRADTHAGAHTHARAHTHPHTVQTRARTCHAHGCRHTCVRTPLGAACGLQTDRKQQTPHVLRGYGGGTGHQRQRLV